MSGTVGERVYEVREALGTRRKPLSQDAFAALLTEQGGRTYYGSEFSLIERNAKQLTLDDVAVIASVDPQRRGKLWLAWGEAVDGTLRTEAHSSSAAAALAGGKQPRLRIPVNEDGSQEKEG